MFSRIIILGMMIWPNFNSEETGFVAYYFYAENITKAFDVFNILYICNFNLWNVTL